MPRSCLYPRWLGANPATYTSRIHSACGHKAKHGHCTRLVGTFEHEHNPYDTNSTANGSDERGRDIIGYWYDAKPASQRMCVRDKCIPPMAHSARLVCHHCRWGTVGRIPDVSTVGSNARAHCHYNSGPTSRTPRILVLLYIVPCRPLAAAAGFSDRSARATRGILESPARNATSPHTRFEALELRALENKKVRALSLFRRGKTELPWYPRTMRKDKEIAFKLRRSGKSYRQIMAELRVPRATLSDWFSKIDWSRRLRAELAHKAQAESTVRIIALDAIRGKRLVRAYAQARREAEAEFETLKYNPLFIAGLMLYWGEGDKRTREQMRLTNTDPKMIRLFVVFLRKVLQIPDKKIRGSVIIYPDLNPESCIVEWSKASRLNMSNFTKCTVIQGRHKTAKLSHGICTICVSSSYLKAKIFEWLRLLPSELMSKRYYASM